MKPGPSLLMLLCGNFHLCSILSHGALKHHEADGYNHFCWGKGTRSWHPELTPTSLVWEVVLDLALSPGCLQEHGGPQFPLSASLPLKFIVPTSSERNKQSERFTRSQSLLFVESKRRFTRCRSRPCQKWPTSLAASPSLHSTAAMPLVSFYYTSGSPTRPVMTTAEPSRGQLLSLAPICQRGPSQSWEVRKLPHGKGHCSQPSRQASPGIHSPLSPPELRRDEDNISP